MQQRDELSEAEWDFRPLIQRKPSVSQSQELHAAIRYEYARESDAIRKLAGEFADLSEDELEASETLTFPRRGHLRMFTAFSFWNCVFWPKFFPRVPWLLIPHEERIKRVASYVAAHPPRAYLEINERDDFEKWELPRERGRVRVGTTENLFVSINWAAANNEEIIAAFAKWVRASRPSDLPEPRGDASRRNVSAAYLTRLAVMRLLHRYRFWDARELALDRSLKMPPRQSNALGMRKEVATDLRELFLAHLFKLAGEFLIPPDELPRSWSTVAEQKRQSRRR
jgi:hypothetical protein